MKSLIFTTNLLFSIVGWAQEAPIVADTPAAMTEVGPSEGGSVMGTPGYELPPTIVAIPPIASPSIGNLASGENANNFMNSAVLDLAPVTLSLTSIEMPPPLPNIPDAAAAARAQGEAIGAAIASLYYMVYKALPGAYQHQANAFNQHYDSYEMNFDPELDQSEINDSAAKVRDLNKPPSLRVLARDGLINNDSIPNENLRLLREQIALKSPIVDLNGFRVRQTINRALLLTSEDASSQELGGMYTLVGYSVGADLAFSEGQNEAGNALLGSAGTMIDMALGFVPLASSINDATQITFGLITGRDYNGSPMKSADFALRGVGIVIGILPSTSLLRFGQLVIDRALIEASIAARWVALDSGVFTAATQVLTHSTKQVGADLVAIVESQNLRYVSQLITDTARPMTERILGLELRFSSVTLQAAEDLNLQALAKGDMAYIKPNTQALTYTLEETPRGLVRVFSPENNASEFGRFYFHESLLESIASKSGSYDEFATSMKESLNLNYLPNKFVRLNHVPAGETVRISETAIIPNWGTVEGHLQFEFLGQARTVTEVESLEQVYLRIKNAQNL